MSSQSKTDEPGYFLGAIVIVALASLLAVAWNVGVPSGPQPRGMGPVFMGLAFILLGITFLACYFVPHKSFLFRWFLKFSVGFPGFPNPKMALFISFMFLLGGSFAVVEGLGFQIR
jgi:hypothetical protein